MLRPRLPNRQKHKLPTGPRMKRVGHLNSSLITDRIERSCQTWNNALAETVNGYCKAELIYGPARTGPWKTVEDVELATLAGCTGTTSAVYTVTSVTFRPPSSKRRSTMHNGPTNP
jgi:hypothetical protein